MHRRHTRSLRSIAEVLRMVVGRACAVLLVLIVVRPGLACAQIPANVDAGVFAHDMNVLLRRSETFRSQCERIARAPRVRVTIELVLGLDSGRAQTAIHRYASGGIKAEVVVLFGENYRELLAHEFEHILEQVEGL